MPGTSDYTTEEVLDTVWIEKETSVKETRKPIAQSGRTSGTRCASDASDITPVRLAILIATYAVDSVFKTMYTNNYELSVRDQVHKQLQACFEIAYKDIIIYHYG